MNPAVDRRVEVGVIAEYRRALPQLADQIWLTDSGLETDLIFHHGFELADFAAFPLVRDPAGRAALHRYFTEHAAVAKAHRTGFVYESPTWRANPDWAERLGYRPGELAALNREAIELGLQLRAEVGPEVPVVLSGCLGPREDGYRPRAKMSVAEAQAYHRSQLEVFGSTAADLVCAMTLGYPDEAIGISQAAAAVEIPVVISFTVETDGRLPDGSALADAIRATDDAAEVPPVYYLLNCAHPAHLAPALAAGGDWTSRVRGLRANASRRSHAELDSRPDLDEGNPTELAADYAQLRSLVPGLTVLGGCCGTDVRHVAAIAATCAPIAASGDGAPGRR